MEHEAADKPDLSIVILTYKRQDELLRTLESIPCQSKLEVIVVNNHLDDTAEVMQRNFPHVKYVDSGSNIGCEARNIGVGAASADIIATIDNDVHIKATTFVGSILDFFNKHPRAGCVNFKVLRPDGELSLRDWCHPRDHTEWSDSEFLTDHISEGASAFRKKAFFGAGGYFAPFFIGHEGPDLCFRMMKAGYEVWYSPRVETFHYASTDARPSWRAYYYNTRNNIWLAYRHFPVIYAIRYVCFYSAMMLVYAFRSGQFTAFFRGFKDGLLKMRSIERSPLEHSDMLKLTDIHLQRPNFVKKVIKHIRSRQAYR